MNTIDAILLTLLNTIACLAFPKLVSVIMAAKHKGTALRTADRYLFTAIFKWIDIFISRKAAKTLRRTLKITTEF